MPSATQEPRIHPSARVHEDASIDPTAIIGEGAVVGAGCVVGPRVSIGAGCVLQARSTIVRDTELGARNRLHSFCVLGDDPQDRAYDHRTPGRLVVGDDNVFREHVTIHRSTEPGPATVIGNDNYFMVYSHAGHNARVGDRNTLANGACLAGHAHIGSGNVLSAFVAVHQFTTMGDMCMIRHAAGVSMHLPPFMTVSETNIIVGLNRVGLARNPDISDADATAVRRAFKALFRDRGARPLLEAADAMLETAPCEPVARLCGFIREQLTQDDPRRRSRGIARHIREGRRHG